MSIMCTAWEQKLIDSLGVSLSQFRFTACLYACIPVSWIQRQIQSVLLSHFYAIFSGFLLIYLPFENSVLTLVPPIIVIYLAMRFMAGYSGYIAWMVCFPYLIYVHFINASGVAWQDGALDATGALMLLFLRLAAIAQCRQNGAKSHSKKLVLTEYEKEHMIIETPSILEFLSYLFCFGNLLSGPFSEFKYYKQFVERRGIWSSKLPPRSTVFCAVLFKSILSLLLLMFVGMRYQYTVFFSQFYRDSSIFEKYLVTIVVGLCHRMRFYFAWHTAEVASIASGFGYKGTTKTDDGKMIEKWDRCRNVDIWQTELPESFAKIPAHWNICTGNFLRRYVYECLTPKNEKPTFFTLLTTQLVSGVWHGLYPGYFLFFASSAVAIFSSKVVHKWEKNKSFYKNASYKILKIILSIIVLNYTASAFMILSLDKSLEVYGSMRFLPHVYCLAVCLMSPLVQERQEKKR